MDFQQKLEKFLALSKHLVFLAEKLLADKEHICFVNLEGLYNNLYEDYMDLQ